MNNKDPDDVHAYCLDCGTQVPDSRAMKDPFITSGKPGSCRTCGGVVAVMHSSDAAREIAKAKQARGIPS